jgi:hypothetical protein
VSVKVLASNGLYASIDLMKLSEILQWFANTCGYSFIGLKTHTYNAVDPHICTAEIKEVTD